MTPSEYAAHARVSRQAVMGAIDAGHLAGAATKVNGRWYIDPALADKLWFENVRPWVSTTGRYADPTPPAAETDTEISLESLYGTTCALVGLIAAIEKDLSRAFRQVVKEAPEADAIHWQAVYAQWGRLPDLLEILQVQARAAIARHKANQVSNDHDNDRRERDDDSHP
jgi:hypothetical protein